MPNEKLITLDRKLWLTADKDRLVEDGDPEARFLFGVAGRKVSASDCKRLEYRANSQISAEDETALILASDVEKAKAEAEAQEKKVEKKRKAKAPKVKQGKKAANKGGKKAANKGDK